MNDVVKYHNYMNSLKFTRFTSVDFNFLIALCSRMKDKDTKKVTFSFEELREITGYTRTSLQVFAKDIMRMNEKLIKMNCTLEQDDEVFQFVLFPTFATSVKKQTLTVAVNEQFKFILNDLVKNFTRFDLKEFIELQSKYAKTLYRLLKQWRGTGQYIFNDIDQFREIMDVPKAYSNMRIWEKIITPAVKEISKLDKSFINFQCEPLYAKKRGKPLAGYKFTWQPEQPPKPIHTDVESTAAGTSSRPPSQPQKTYYNKPKNQFFEFHQREVTDEELDELEKKLLANNCKL